MSDIEWSNMSDIEWLKEKIKRRDDMLNIRWAEIEKLKTRSSFWHGKWAIVCHENNVLRKKAAAAQELLEACQYLVEWSKYSSGTSKAAVDKARAAISKATGE